MPNSDTPFAFLRVCKQSKAPTLKGYQSALNWIAIPPPGASGSSISFTSPATNSVLSIL